MSFLFRAFSFHQEKEHGDCTSGKASSLGSLRGLLDVTVSKQNFKGKIWGSRIERDGNEPPEFLFEGERWDSIQAPVIVEKFNRVRVLADILGQFRIRHE